MQLPAVADLWCRSLTKSWRVGAAVKSFDRFVHDSVPDIVRSCGRDGLAFDNVRCTGGVVESALLVTADVADTLDVCLCTIPAMVHRDTATFALDDGLYSPGFTAHECTTRMRVVHDGATCTVTCHGCQVRKSVDGVYMLATHSQNFRKSHHSRSSVPITSAMRAFGASSDKAIVQAIVAASNGRLSEAEVGREVWTTLKAGHAVADGAERATGADGAKVHIDTTQFMRDATDDRSRLLTLARMVAACIASPMQRCSPNAPGQADDDGRYHYRPERSCASVCAVDTLNAKLTRVFAKSLRAHIERVSETGDVRNLDDQALQDAMYGHEIYANVADGIRILAADNGCPQTLLFDSAYTLGGDQYGFLCGSSTDIVRGAGGPCAGSIRCAATLCCGVGVSSRADAKGVIGAVRAFADRESTRGTDGVRTLLTAVTVDGYVVAYVSRPGHLATGLREKRYVNAGASIRERPAWRDVGISWSVGNDVSIRTSEGRLLRPLIDAAQLRNVTSGARASPTTWKRCRSGPNPLVTYLDEHECATSCLIARTIADATDERYTHAEVHPVLAFSPAYANVPFANHCPAHVVSNAPDPCADDNPSSLLHVPLIDTVVGRGTGTGCMIGGTPGVDAMVAFAPCGGYNMLVNRASMQRGMFARSFDSSRGGSSVTGIRARCGFMLASCAIVQPHDMPFCASTGSVPDLVIDPSRAQDAAACLSMEMLAAFTTCHLGDLDAVDASAFQAIGPDGLETVMNRHDLCAAAHLCRPESGTPLADTVLMAPLFVAPEYAALPHQMCASAPDDVTCAHGLLAHGLASTARERIRAVDASVLATMAIAASPQTADGAWTPAVRA